MLVNLTTTNSLADLFYKQLKLPLNGMKYQQGRDYWPWPLRPSGGWGLSGGSLTHWAEARHWLCKNCRLSPLARVLKERNKISSAGLQSISLRRVDEPRKGKCYREITQDLTLDSFLWRHCLSTISFYLLTASWSRNPVLELSSNLPQNWNSGKLWK